MTLVQDIISRAISPASVRLKGPLTTPRSYGVYRIPSKGGSTRSFRYGNHPVRQRELEAEFGACTLVHLFTSRDDAKAVAQALEPAV